MTDVVEETAGNRFAFSERSEPFRLRERPPHVYGYAWRHPAPKATLVLIHGLQSHAQWFAESADLLLDRGFSVYALDRRGSGSSPETRGDIADYRDWFDEVTEVAALARSERPDVATHLIGHCFGANLALGSAMDARVPIASIAMLTPGLYITPDYSAPTKALIAASAFLQPQRRFPVPQNDGMFTRDPAVLAWIRGDTLGAKTLTARCLLQTNRMLGRLRRDVGRVGVRILVFEAARDRISDNEGNRRLLSGALGDSVTFQTLDAEHFLLTEWCRDDVLDAIDRWATPAST
ncbi:MAG TPA: alpha/beta fold hydrolase [Chloroflexota bacterium]|nr:alpha/beta fold hydrolase [Chloroflexota bacterium]